MEIWEFSQIDLGKFPDFHPATWSDSRFQSLILDLIDNFSPFHGWHGGC